MKLLIIVITFLFFGMELVCARNEIPKKEIPELESAFENFHYNKPIELEEAMQPQSLNALIAQENHTIIQALYILQKIKQGAEPNNTDDLMKLFEVHNKKAFHFLHPENWKSVRAKDYERWLCSEIIAIVMRKFEEEQQPGKAQNATRAESKSKIGDQPQMELEGRPE